MQHCSWAFIFLLLRGKYDDEFARLLFNDASDQTFSIAPYKTFFGHDFS